MKNYLKNRYALTDKGAKGTVVAIIYSTLKSLSFMMPIILLMYVLNGLLGFGNFDIKIAGILSVSYTHLTLPTKA